MMVNSLASSRAPSRQASASLRSQPATPEALTPNHASRDASATDLVRVTSQFDADEVSRHLRAAENSAESRSSSVAEWQERMQVSSFEAARYRQTANAAGQAAGALNAEVSVPELTSGTGPLPTADVSGRPSDVGSGAGGDLRAGSARSTTSERTSTWLSRVTAKSDDLRAVFGLPETEVRHPIRCTSLTFSIISDGLGAGMRSGWSWNRAVHLSRGSQKLGAVVSEARLAVDTEHACWSCSALDTISV